MKPDRVVFNALISACGQAGAVDRAFDVLAEMTTEPELIDPDHITVGALMKACANSGQVSWTICSNAFDTYFSFKFLFSEHHIIYRLIGHEKYIR